MTSYCLIRLITQRSVVQIHPPQPNYSSTYGRSRLSALSTSTKASTNSIERCPSGLLRSRSVCDLTEDGRPCCRPRTTSRWCNHRVRIPNHFACLPAVGQDHRGCVADRLEQRLQTDERRSVLAPVKVPPASLGTVPQRFLRTVSLRRQVCPDRQAGMEDIQRIFWIDSTMQLWWITAGGGNSHLLIRLSIQLWGIPGSDSDSAVPHPSRSASAIRLSRAGGRVRMRDTLRC
jgi:hypothetical protein